MKALLLTATLLLSLAVVSPVIAWSDTDKEPQGAAAVVIPEITDLRLEAAQAQRDALPILVMFSSEYCPYCRVMKDDFLKPMVYSGAYDKKILFRMIELRAGHQLIDFDGNKVNVWDFANRYKVRVTPTLVFLDFQGKPMAPKMVGLTTPDYFGGYLDDAINTAYNHAHHGSSTFACKDAHTKLAC